MAIQHDWKPERRLALIVTASAALLLAGDSTAQADVINPAGPIATAERDLLLTAF